MREKMARAMYHAVIVRSRYVILDAKDVTLTVHAWELQSQALHDDWLAAVDAGLDALMEPTEEMVEAAAEVIGNDRPEHHGFSDQHLAIVGHDSMIRAAKEGK